MSQLTMSPKEVEASEGRTNYCSDPLTGIKAEDSDSHYLQIELIELILQHVDVDRLKICRRVCRAWNREVCKILKRKAITSLKKREYTSFSELNEDQERLHMPCPFQDLELILDSSNLELALGISFSLEYCVTKISISFPLSPGGRTESVLSSVIQQCAPSLKCLETQFFCLSAKDLSFPALAELIIIEDPNRFPSTNDQDVDFFIRMIPASPKLSNLEIRGFRLAARLLGAVDLRRLRHLRIIRQLGCNDVTLLKALSLVRFYNLKSLYLEYFVSSPESNLLLSQILENISESVETLELVHTSLQVDLPPCPNLKCLRVERLENWNFNNLPTLKCLSIERVYDDFMRDTEDAFPCPNIETIKVHFLCLKEYEDALLFSRLAELCPNVSNWALSFRYITKFSSFASTHQGTKVETLSITFGGFGLADQKSLDQALTAVQEFRGLKELKLMNNSDNCMSINISKIHFVGMPNLRSFQFVYIPNQMDLEAITKLSNSVDIVEALLQPCSKIRQDWNEDTEYFLFKAGNRFLGCKNIWKNEDV